MASISGSSKPKSASMCEFIFESGGGVKNVETRKAIRSQAMRHFRTKQRAETARSTDENSERSAPRKRDRTLADRSQKTRRLLPAPTATSRPELRAASSGPREQTVELESPEVDDTVSIEDIPRANDDQQLALFDSTHPKKILLTGSYTFDLANMQIRDIPATQIYRDQLHQAFIMSYYSDAVVCLHKDFIDRYYWRGPKSQALDASRDALFLIQLGTRFQDDRLLTEGRKIHCMALRLIREEIEKPNAITDDCILGACYTVAHCEVFKVMSSQEKGWRVHMDGLLYLLRKRGPKSFKSSFAKAVFHNIRQISAMDQLLKRKKSFLSSPNWLTNVDGTDQPAFQLTNLAFRTSEMLETAGNLADLVSQHNMAPTGTIEETFECMDALVLKLHQWLVDFYRSCGPEPVHYRLVDITKVPLLEGHRCELAGLSDQVYEFQNLLRATTHIYVWICLLAIRMSQLDLASVAPPEIPSTFATLVYEADDYAIHLCRSLAFMSLQQHRSAGMLASSGPLYWASAWFERSGNFEMKGACRRVREAFERDSPTPLNLQHPVFTWWMLPNIFDKAIRSG